MLLVLQIVGCYKYLAETSDGQTILVKFVRQYCPELYDICAASGHAPTLLAYERLPGRWYGESLDTAGRQISLASWGTSSTPVFENVEAAVRTTNKSRCTSNAGRKICNSYFQNFMIEAWSMAIYATRASSKLVDCLISVLKPYSMSLRL